MRLGVPTAPCLQRQRGLFYCSHAPTRSQAPSNCAASTAAAFSTLLPLTFRRNILFRQLHHRLIRKVSDRTLPRRNSSSILPPSVSGPCNSSTPGSDITSYQASASSRYSPVHHIIGRACSTSTFSVIERPSRSIISS